MQACDVDVARLCALAADDRYAGASSSRDGLTHAEAARRLREYGANAMQRVAARSSIAALVANLSHPLALLLWFGAVMAFAARAPELASAIVGVVIINGAFATLQEYRAERVVEALLARAALFARVTREGREHVVPAAELVVGDVVLLAIGDVVPADCLLVQADALSLDLSLLTGETTPVNRTAERDARQKVDIATRTCIAPAGAGVLRGAAVGIVVAIGAASTLGQIERLLDEPGRGASLLERQVSELSRITAVVAVTCGAATLALAIYFRGTNIVVALTFGTGVIVALVPEGLLPLLTVSLAMAARRMADRGALVRRLSAIEVVGATTVICTDKTGTLTQNTLAVLAFEPCRATSDVEGRAQLVAALCNDAHDDDTGDPIDRALLRWTGRDTANALRKQYPRSGGMPFDPERRYMRVDSGGRQLIKGAPEAVAALVAARLPDELARAVERATTHGERVLLLAEGPVDGEPEYVGLIRLHDPPRPEVPTAIAACKRAGIRVVMVTGDHPATARAIAIRIGLADETAVVLDGDSIDALDEHSLADRLRDTVILARTTPEQKLRVVRALRSAGQIVTVTGDGVNDAPALRMADVGIAMGRRGTEVAKQASDIVLLDENFATIVAAIEEGRAIKHNIRRFASYVFTSNVSELVPFLFYIFAGVQLPLTILQILAIDLGTDLLPALALGLEPASPRALDVPPERPRAPLLTRAIAVRTFLFYGVLEAALAMAAFFAGHESGPTLTFLGIVGGQIGCLFAQRDGTLRARLSLRDNRWITLGIAVELALALALVYVPGINTIFAMSAVGPAWLLVVPATALIMVTADELRRRISGAPAQV